MREIATKVLIIGSGPAGVTAGIYAARANLKPILLSGIQPGGQLTITTEVENYPGFAHPVQGPWLTEQMLAQARNVGCEIIIDNITDVDFSKTPFKLFAANVVYVADAVIIATGATAKWLGLVSEKKFTGFGVSGCATCDGFFFKNKNVVVVGGGNTAVEEALYLTNHASKVTLVHRRDFLRAEKIMQDRLFKNPKIEILWNHKIEEILGTENPNNVTSINLQNLLTNEIFNYPTDGVFVAIGHKPNTEIFKDFIEIDQEGYIITKPDSTKTNIEGIFAAGDVKDKIFRQAVTAAGMGCMAALEVEKFLSSHNIR